MPLIVRSLRYPDPSPFASIISTEIGSQIKLNNFNSIDANFFAAHSGLASGIRRWRKFKQTPRQYVHFNRSLSLVWNINIGRCIHVHMGKDGPA